MIHLAFRAARLMAISIAVTLSPTGAATSAAVEQTDSGAPPRAAVVAVVRIDGSNGVIPLASALRRAFGDQDESLDIVIGTGLGGKERLDALADHSIDIALASHGLDLAELARRGMTAHRIALTPVVFAVHSDVTQRDLRARDVCDIFLGRITNWASLGGPDLKVRPYMRPEAEVDTEIVRASLPCMKSIVFPPSITIARTTSEMLAVLQNTPGAIGVTTSTAVRQSIVALRSLSIDSVTPLPENVTSGRYPLSRPAYFVTLTTPSRPVERFLEWVRGDRGAAVIIENGALPVR